MLINKKTRAFAACLLAVLILPVLTACVISPSTDIEPGLNISGKRVDMTVPESGSYFYNQLTDIEKAIYVASVTSLETSSNVFELRSVNCSEYSDACKRAVNAVLRDHPEFFWLDGGYQIKSTRFGKNSDGNIEITLTSHPYWADKNIDAAYDELTDAVAELAVQVNSFTDPYDKVKFLNDWLAENVEYDFDSFTNPSERTDADDAFINTVYGTLVERKTLCGGYAYTFSYIMNSIGIETLYITGITEDGRHAWNAVKLDGEYYYIDTTWADDNENGKIIYSYFCLNSEEMSRTHTADDLFKYPEATASECNYYLREGLYLESYSFNKYNLLFSKHRDQGDFSVKFPNEVVLNAAVSDIIEKSKFYKLEGMENAGTFSYIVDDVHYILTLYP